MIASPNPAHQTIEPMMSRKINIWWVPCHLFVAKIMPELRRFGLYRPPKHRNAETGLGAPLSLLHV